MEINKYIFKTSASGIFNSAVSAITVVVLLPVIIKNIGLDLFGIWSTLNVFLGLGNLVDMGVSRSIAHFLPKVEINKKKYYFSSGLVIVLITVVLVIIFGIAIYNLNLELWGAKSNISSELNDYILFSGIGLLIIRVFTQYFKGVLEGNYKLYTVNILNMMTTILTHIGLIVLIVIDKTDVKLLILSTLIAHMMILLMMIYSACNNKEFLLAKPRVKMLKELLAYALKSIPIGIVDIIMAALNRILFIRLGGSVDAYGLYEFLLKVAVTAKALLTTFSQPLFSIFSNYGKGRINQINKIISVFSKRLFVGYIAGFVIYTIIGDKLLNYFIGDTSLNYTLIGYICVFGIAFAGVAEPFLKALLALGDFRRAFVVKIMVPIIYFIILVLMLDFSTTLILVSAFSGSYFFNSLLYIVAYKTKYQKKLSLCKS